MFTNLRLIVFFLAIQVLMVGGGYIYASGLKHKLEKTEHTQQILQLKVDGYETVLTQMRTDIKKLNELQLQVNAEFAATDAAVNSLSRRLNAAQLRTDALANPSTIQMMINRQTKFTIRCNELAAGGIVAHDDKTNDVCPELVK